MPGAAQWLAELIAENQRIHDETCMNLNPATNRMNPRAEQMLAARLGTRASLGYPGEKYETGWRRSSRSRSSPPTSPPRVFHADYAEVRVGSGALANLYAFMAICEPGDPIIAPPAHHRRARHPPRATARPGCTGLTHRRRAGRRRTATPSTSTRWPSSPTRSGRS